MIGDGSAISLTHIENIDDEKYDHRDDDTSEKREKEEDQDIHRSDGGFLW